MFLADPFWDPENRIAETDESGESDNSVTL